MIENCVQIALLGGAFCRKAVRKLRSWAIFSAISSHESARTQVAASSMASGFPSKSWQIWMRAY